MKVFAVAVVAGLLVHCTTNAGEPDAKKLETTAEANSQTNAPTGTPSLEDVLRKAAAIPSEPLEGTGWMPLFDGKTLEGWKETEFAGHGEVHCEFGMMVLEMGNDFTGVNRTNEPPTVNYEIALDAMRVGGSDFFCGLTFPVKDSFCSLIVGGWGGSVVGLSSIDGQDASENETTKFMRFDPGRWYRIRLRVTEKKIEVWLDKEKIVDLNTTGKKIGLRLGEIENSKPLGIATWDTVGAVREIKMRRIEAGDSGKK